MKAHLKFVHVDAFTRSPFRGAQVAVCVLPNRLSPEQMQTAAEELALPESAFLVKLEDGRFEIRAFDGRGNACDPAGTAALAAGHALFTEGHAGRGNALVFDAPRESFRVERRSEHTTLIVTPRHLDDYPTAPAALASQSERPVLFNGADLVLMLADEKAVAAFTLDAAASAAWPGERLVVTAEAEPGPRDFVVRTFGLGVSAGAETHVCGAAYRALGPYWLERLKLPVVRGEQAHRRGGIVHAERGLTATALAISGQAVTTVKGIFTFAP